MIFSQHLFALFNYRALLRLRTTVVFRIVVFQVNGPILVSDRLTEDFTRGLPEPRPEAHIEAGTMPFYRLIAALVR